MRLPNLFRRSNASGKPDQTPERDRVENENTDGRIEPEHEDIREASLADYLDIPEPARELDQPGRQRQDAQQAEDPTLARARELREEYFRAMTLENTPAAFASDEYDYDDDVWCDDLYSTPGSVKVERELGELVRAHPTVFAGTEFEVFAGQDEHGEDQDRPPERDHELADGEIDDGAPF